MEVVLSEGALLTIFIVGPLCFLVFAILSFYVDWQWED